MTRSTNMEHVEVLERLRCVLEHGKMGDKCLIAPDLVTAAIAALSAPQPPAEAQADWEVAPPGATHYQPHQGAYYKRVSASEWYVWSRIEPCELLRWLPSPGTSDSAEWVVRPAEAQPVGVEGLVAKWRGLANDALRRSGTWNGNDIADRVEFMADELEALSQQPAYDGGFTAADMMDARQEGRKEAQQPAAVDDDTLESLIEESDGHWSEDEFRIEGPDLMRLLRDAALAAQQGGRSDD